MGKLTIHFKNFFHEVKRKRVLFLMILPILIYFFVFAYIPMPGAYIAFVDYSIGKGIFGSPFVGLKNFEFLAKTGDLWRITKNTLLYNVAFLVLCNVFQVAFAIMLAELGSKWFKKLSQSIILLPYFISMVIVGFFAYNFFNYDHGFVNTLLTGLGFPKHDFYSDQGIWKYIIVFFKIWSQTGYGMIVYLATITGIDAEIYEAASLDGANPVQKIKYLTLPLLKTTVILLFLFGLGGILKGSFDLFFNLIGSNSILYPQTDIIDTFVFRSLVSQFNFSQGAAVGFYQSIFGLILVLVVNAVVKKIEPESALF
ncbi:ABC transporter permease [Anaerocolumna chitinilytica]|uniref:Sugar ABC transporter permease n=1 Tax=Anaerocolumna chitinilytica TaxID=1727145 RepID=A0A7I8DLJ8_9FIRM|nr:ABC transporter permease subunit [Anaerocolumna chitinilytica]BCJ99240.1 sugar ABC transporter permease [Anaerocolumna chitinilytica]